jgi:hypothetical protein
VLNTASPAAYDWLVDNLKIVETRSIMLPQGMVLEVQMTQKFIDELKQHFCVSDDQPLHEDQVRAYVLEAVENAVVAAEREVKDVAKPKGNTERVSTPSASTQDVRRPRRRKKDARG